MQICRLGWRAGYVDETPEVNGNPLQQGYDPSYADPRGRVWYARVSYRWR